MRWFFCTNEGDLQKKWSDTSGLSEHFTGAKLPEKYEIAQNFDAKSLKIYEIAQNFDTLNPARGGLVPPRPHHLLRHCSPLNEFLVTCQHQATAFDLPFYDIFAPTKNSSFELSDYVIACDLWFGPPPIKNRGYAYVRRPCFLL